MTSSRVAYELAAVLVPLGIIGAVLAALCAVVAAVAIVRGAGGVAGGAVGIWIPCAVLSLTASFANQWVPVLVAGAALGGMLVIGAVVRGIVSAGEPRRIAARAASVSVAEPAAEPAPASRPSASTSTGTVPALAG